MHLRAFFIFIFNKGNVKGTNSSKSLFMHACFVFVCGFVDLKQAAQ